VSGCDETSKLHDRAAVPARPENALREKLIEADELSELLGVGRWLTDRRRDLAPPPAGRAGNRNFWVRADVEKWLDADTRRREKVAARKRSQRRRRSATPRAR
jgi:hypothetical protein